MWYSLYFESENRVQIKLFTKQKYSRGCRKQTCLPGDKKQGQNKLWEGIDINTMCSVTQLCPTLCDLTDCSLPGSSVHGILQARILEWVAISSFRGSSWPRDWAHVSWVSACIGRWILYHCTTWDECSQPHYSLIVKEKRQSKCQSTSVINRTWCIHITEYFSAIIGNEVVIHGTT